ncbi:MAG: carbamoyltransferase HypF [Anaerolineales bacterium]|nr:carbamoyltransferase HypF [Anaerolineales bacterium]
MSELSGASLHITGIVQGVGFRPFVYSLAKRYTLTGWVRNTSAGVDIELDGTKPALDDFLFALKNELPPLARIDDLQATGHGPNGFTTFEILHSEAVAGAFQPISPDVSLCPDCLRELFDLKDRRYRYPFINCTNCGPRFTIITDIPYDRPNTTMAPFAMCPNCAAEYQNPLDRRFHAQPVACPVCGPGIWLERLNVQTFERSNVENDAIFEAQRLLAQGKIVAIKGLGGFHLACDATNSQAVTELRNRKLRVDKPFALMMPDLETVEKHCFVNDAERVLLESRQRPIVLLYRRPESNIAAEVAPRQDTLGVMLPYTPLHYLLFAPTNELHPSSFIFHPSSFTLHPSSFTLHPSSFILHPLVMTSGNLSEEPIATDNDEARQRLASLADAFLMHNRDIRTRCDDSVVRTLESWHVDTFEGSNVLTFKRANVYFLRRSRGYAPDPLQLPFDAPPLLATGAELKNTFCLTRERYAFLSHHIGDMQNYETLRSFEDGVAHFERLFRIQPEAIAHDLHPDYLSTRYALQRAELENLPTFAVQHHHAHVAACMAEHGLRGESPVIGVAFDGTGYGEDGAIWGGEFLIADYASYQRLYHLAYFPLPGGDAAIRRPARTALALLWQLGLDWDERLAPVIDLCDEERMALRVQLERGLNAPLTSSMGRLFDAAAALASVRQKVNYEAQAAIEFEALADERETGEYPFAVNRPEASLRALSRAVQPRPAIEALIADALGGTPVAVISARFHNGLAEMVREVCCRIRSESNINVIALSGGVWQNQLLLARTLARLQEEGFQVYIHRQAPPNDGGLAFGQAAVAIAKMQGTA